MPHTVPPPPFHRCHRRISISDRPKCNPALTVNLTHLTGPSVLDWYRYWTGVLSWLENTEPVRFLVDHALSNSTMTKRLKLAMKIAPSRHFKTKILKKFWGGLPRPHPTHPLCCSILARRCWGPLALNWCTFASFTPATALHPTHQWHGVMLIDLVTAAVDHWCSCGRL